MQDTAASLYGWHLDSKIFNGYYRKTYKFLEESQWHSADKLRDYQGRQLISFLRYAVKNVPYYRDYFARQSLTVEDIRTVDDLKLFPLLDKETVRFNADRLIAEPYRKRTSQVVNVHTSGTTGKGLHLKLSKEAFQREYAFRYLHLSWAGIKPNMKMAFFAGHPVTPPERLSPPFWAEDKINKRIYFSSQHITNATLPIYIDKLKEFKPELIRGYPSSVYLIGVGILEHGAKGVSPKAVFTNSETLLGYQREVIERAFSCKVFDWYGNTEQVANIVECERGNRHVKAEHSFVEFLKQDGMPAKPGELAEMVCTGFGNYAMPLIRYRVGDMAVLSDRGCSCGRNDLIVDKIVGRVEDIVVTPDGRHVGRLDHLFKDMLNVKEAQIVQEMIEELKIRIVKRKGFNDKDLQLLEKEARLRLGNSIRFQFEFVDHLEREPSGKLRFVISRIPRDAQVIF